MKYEIFDLIIGKKWNIIIDMQQAKGNLLFIWIIVINRKENYMQNEKDDVATIERTNETKTNNHSVRSDYYPFNQTFLDDYYKQWEVKKSKS